MRMLLIVKENMRLQSFQYSALIHAAQEMGFVNGDVPAAQGMDHPAVGGGTAGGDNGSFQKTFVSGIAFFFFIFQHLKGKVQFFCSSCGQEPLRWKFQNGCR